ncbi:MAG: D-aminoacyl-tRNA deacylase [Mycoplasmatales bacterium]
MRVVIQRVKKAAVEVNSETVGEIKQGLCLLVGFTANDSKVEVMKVASKIMKMRIFTDEEGKLNRSIEDINGEILSISQFTVYADCKKGNRPSFTKSMNFTEASALYDIFNQELIALNATVKTGIFGADMAIELVNDGPVTIILDSDEL